MMTIWLTLFISHLALTLTNYGGQIIELCKQAHATHTSWPMTGLHLSQLSYAFVVSKSEFYLFLYLLRHIR